MSGDSVALQASAVSAAVEDLLGNYERLEKTLPGISTRVAAMQNGNFLSSFLPFFLSLVILFFFPFTHLHVLT